MSTREMGMEGHRYTLLAGTISITEHEFPASNFSTRVHLHTAISYKTQKMRILILEIIYQIKLQHTLTSQCQPTIHI